MHPRRLQQRPEGNPTLPHCGVPQAQVPGLYRVCDLSETDTKEDAKKLLGYAAEDDKWPSDADSRWILVGCKWEHGYWLVRFRVTLDIAVHIRDKMDGLIQINTHPFQVFHMSRPWKKGRDPVLVHEDTPDKE